METRLQGIRRKAWLGVTALPLAVAMGVPGYADAQEDPEMRNAATMRKLHRLEREVERNRKAIEASKGGDHGLHISTKGGIKIRSADGNFKAQLGGRIMADGAVYDTRKTEMGDGAEIRRARLFMKGTLYRIWGYKLQLDFAGNKVAVKDAYLQYKGLHWNGLPIHLTMGNFKEPYSLEEQTSSKYITFMERALPIVFSPGRHLGFKAGTHGANWTVNGGLFGAAVAKGASGEANDGYDLAGRITFAPLYGKTQALHLGVGVVYHTPNGQSVRFRERPESHVTGARLVDTGTIADIDHSFTVDPELAAVYGPFSVQGEYAMQHLSRSMGGNLDFSGYYIQASWFVTGESRRYEPEKGKFGRVKPLRNFGAGGPGAWEVAVRYSTLDLTDGAVTGGRERDITVGVNWYVNPHVRFMLNYVRAMGDSDATGNAKHLLPGQTSAGSERANIVQARAQIDF